jgi:hypothetical protein
MPWLRAQSINVNRHAAALRPFRRDEFGTGAAAPTEAHLQAANDLIRSLRTGLPRLTRKVSSAVDGDRRTNHAAPAGKWCNTKRAQLGTGHRAHLGFLLELFGQRRSGF